MSLNLDKLSRDLVRERGETGLRVAAQEIGVSAATLCRVENGCAPDLISFAKLCRWLNADPAVYLGLRKARR